MLDLRLCCASVRRRQITNSASKLSVDSASPEAETLAMSHAVGRVNLAHVAF